MEHRSILRTQLRDLRKKLSPSFQQKAGYLLKNQLKKHPKVIAAKRIALYLANDGELNPDEFIHWCWLQGKEVYLPVFHPFNKRNLLFIRYDSKSKLIKTSFRLYQPKLDVSKVCPVLEIDIIFTPLVAFDKSCARLGMGGGYYDRTLATWYKHYLVNKTLHNVYPIGIAHDCQQIDSVPVECWDIPLPEIITPSQHFFKKNHC